MLKRVMVNARPRDALAFVRVFVKNSLPSWIWIDEDAPLETIRAAHFHPHAVGISSEWAGRVAAGGRAGGSCEVTLETVSAVWEDNAAQAWWAALLVWLEKRQLTGKPKRPRGRPRGSGFIANRAEFMIVLAKLESQSDGPVTQAEVAEFLHCDEREIRRLCDSYEIDWRSLRKRQKSTSNS